MSSNLWMEPLLTDGASEEFVRPVFEIPQRLTIPGADDGEGWDRQLLIQVSSST